MGDANILLLSSSFQRNPRLTVSLGWKCPSCQSCLVAGSDSFLVQISHYEPGKGTIKTQLFQLLIRSPNGQLSQSLALYLHGGCVLETHMNFLFVKVSYSLPSLLLLCLGVLPPLFPSMGPVGEVGGSLGDLSVIQARCCDGILQVQHPAHLASMVLLPETLALPPSLFQTWMSVRYLALSSAATDSV